jgi:NADPH2:quinone reductase
MKAVGITHYLPVSECNAFVDFQSPTPTPAGHDVLVAISAIAVNPVDTKVRAGRGTNSVVEDPARVIG